MTHRESGCSRLYAERGGDRIEARLQRIEAVRKRVGVRPYAGELVQRRENVEACSIAVRISAGRELFRFAPRFAAAEAGNRFKQRVSCRAKRTVRGQQAWWHVTKDEQVETEQLFSRRKSW